MFVCGGSTTCFSVCSGVVTCVRNWREALRQALARSGRVEEAAAARRRRRAAEALLSLLRGGGAAWLPDAGLLEAGLDLRELRRGRRLDPAEDVDLVAARLDLGDDLRHDALLVHAGEHEAGRHRGDAVERRDRVRLALRERELRARQEEVVHEVRAGLAELREVGDGGLVRLDQVAAAAAAAGPEAAGVLLRRRERDGQVGADRRERVERASSARGRGRARACDGDHERDADREAGKREDRPRSSAEQLAANVAEVEHRRLRNHDALRPG